MALNLSTTGIVDGQVITAAQITQSIDALTGAAAYNITISGSFGISFILLLIFVQSDFL